jgi:hypothetical protein
MHEALRSIPSIKNIFLKKCSKSQIPHLQNDNIVLLYYLASGGKRVVDSWDLK